MIETIQQLTGDSIGRVGTFDMILRALIVFAYGLLLGRLALWRTFPPQLEEPAQRWQGLAH